MGGGLSNSEKCGQGHLRRGGAPRVAFPKASFVGEATELEGVYYNCAKSYSANVYNVSVNFIDRYVVRKYNHGTNIHHVVLKVEQTTLKITEDVSASAIETVRKIWKIKVSHYVKRK